MENWNGRSENWKNPQNYMQNAKPYAPQNAKLKRGQNQTKIAKTFGVSEKTIGRSDGWRNWESYDKIGQNQTKLDNNIQELQSDQETKLDKRQNLDIDIENDIDNDIEKDIETDLSQMEVDPESDTTPTPGFEKYSPDEIRNFRRLGFVI